MSALQSGPGRRLKSGLYGSLVFVAVGTVLFLAQAPYYQLFFYVFIVYVTWVGVRFLQERKGPINRVPWYASKPKLGIFGALVNVLLGVLDLHRNDTGYRFDFLLAAVFLIGAASFHYKEKRANQASTDQE
jgi:hypothetical protein